MVHVHFLRQGWGGNVVTCSESYFVHFFSVDMTEPLWQGSATAADNACLPPALLCIPTFPPADAAGANLVVRSSGNAHGNPCRGPRSAHPPLGKTQHAHPFIPTPSAIHGHSTGSRLTLLLLWEFLGDTSHCSLHLTCFILMPLILSLSLIFNILIEKKSWLYVAFRVSLMVIQTVNDSSHEPGK